MEAFTLLKYWRAAPGLRLLSSSTTTILTDSGDDGPFFDIEFTLPDDAEDGNHNHHNEEDEECEAERDLKLMQIEDPNISLSPSEDLFFNGKLLHVVDDDNEPNPKPHHFNSSSKFRVFMSALKKSKSTSSDSLPPESSHKNKKKDSSQEEKQRFSKEAMQKYLKLVKPLYVKVSRRYGDKFNDKGSSKTQKKHDPSVKVDNSSSSNITNNKSQKVTAGLRVVCKHLGKSRSASSAVAAAAAPPLLSSNRRDDSLLQQEDGIQGAILHCKTSFNASTECEIPRFVSEQLHEK